MPVSVDRCFDLLVDDLTPRAADQRCAEARLAPLADALAHRYAPLHLAPIGSLGHGTSLPGHTVLDALVVVPADRLKIDSAAMLQAIAAELRERLPTAGVAISPPAVVVHRAAGAADACALIPAEPTGRSVHGAPVYHIPGRAGGWMRSGPQAYRAWVDAEDRRLDGRLKPLVRILKAWSHADATGLRSLWIELRTTQWASEQAVIRYPVAVSGVLRHMLAYAHAMPDPLDAGAPIEACALADHTAAFAAVAGAADHAAAAVADESAGDLNAALAHWRRAFDGHFPRFG